MNIKQIITVGVAGMAMGALALDNVEVTDVKARQRYPWNGKVDIDFTLDSKPTEPYQMQVEVYDNVGKTNLPVKSVCTEGISFEENPTMVREDTRRIIWDASKDLPNGFRCTNVLVTCRDSRVNADAKRYLIVDLSSGASSSKYPVSYTNCPPSGGWTEEHLMTKLILRRIEAGCFEMGSATVDPGRSDNEDLHRVSVTKPYYIGVFKLTEAQLALISGGTSISSKPVKKDWYSLRGVDVTINELEGSYHDASKYGVPSEADWFCLSRGVTNNYFWPTSSAVDNDSIIGCLRIRTGLQFDLPTEAQWERACRAGAQTALYSGKSNSVENCQKLTGDPKYDQSGDHLVYLGQYLPNAFGLYDMSGAGDEWCLDVYATNLGREETLNPIGSFSVIEQTIVSRQSSFPCVNYYYGIGCKRVLKGGGYRSASRIASALILNNTGSCFKKYWSHSNPLATVRLAVRIEN